MLIQEVEGLKPIEDRTVREWREIQELLQDTLVLYSPVSLHLIRHAESRINADRRVTGSQDVDLTPNGEEQAARLGRKLSKYYDLAFASTLQRSQKTLEIAINSGGIKVGHVFRDHRLNERSLGVLEGQEFQWIPEYACGDLNFAPEQGESYEKVAKRIFSFLIDLAYYTSENRMTKILISGHMGPMRVMAGIIREESDPVKVLGLTFPNAEVVKLSWKSLQIPGFLQEISDVSI